LFLLFIHDFIQCVDFTILPVSQLQTEELMTSQIRSHRIFSTDLLYSCAHFIVKIDEKCSLHDGL